MYKHRSREWNWAAGLRALALGLLLVAGMAAPGTSQANHDHSVPDCGYENERACKGTDWEFAHNGSGNCDRGLKTEHGAEWNDCVDGNTSNSNRHQFDEPNGWVVWALDNQANNLGYDEPVNWATRLMAHNAYNSWKNAYNYPNQWYSIADQLKAGARSMELDLVWSNGAVRLSHGTKWPTDRMYAYAIREVADWLDDHPEAILVLYLENSAGDSHQHHVKAPIIAFLGERVLRASEKPAGRWPTVREMRAGGNQVIILDDNADNDWTFGSAMPGYKSAWPRRFSASNCTGNEGSFDFVPRTEQWSRMYEDRVSLDTAGAPATPLDYWAGLINESRDSQYVPDTWTSGHRQEYIVTVPEITACGVSLLSLDFFAAANHTIAAEVMRHGKADERREAAVWSWAAGDHGQYGMAALLDKDGDQRWHSRAKSEVAHFACAKSRPPAEWGMPLNWSDPEGREWGVTKGTGAWSQGGRQCVAEFGNGWEFSVPRSGYQNKQLLAQSTSGDLWLNYHRERTGIWEVNHAPRAVLTAAPVTINEGDAVAFDGSTSTDPNGDTIADFSWTFGDGDTASGPTSSHRYLDDNPGGTPSDTYTAMLAVSDNWGATGTAEIVVTVNNVAPLASIDRIMDESGEVLEADDVALEGLSIDVFESLTDAGVRDTHTATRDWGDGAMIADLGLIGAQTTGRHVYARAGSYTILLTVIDDDTGVDTVTRQVVVVTAIGATEKAISDLGRVTSSQPAARDAINRALENLNGNHGGRASNGALDMLRKGNLNAAMNMFTKAVEELRAAEKADPALNFTSLKRLLTLTTKSVAVNEITRAQGVATREAQERKVAEAQVLVEEGQRLLVAGNYVGAIEKFQVATRTVATIL